MYEFKKLFQPIKIGTMELKNRIAFGEQAPQASHGYITRATEDFMLSGRGAVAAWLWWVAFVLISRGGGLNRWPESMMINTSPCWLGWENGCVKQP